MSMEMEFIKVLPSPQSLMEDYPLSHASKLIKLERDQIIKDIFTGKDDRFLAIIGPCSSDNEEAVVDYVSRLAKLQEKIKDKVIVQSGYTKYSSNNMDIVDLMPMDKFNKCINDCDILITHGGVGTILDGLKKGKKIIAFPRLSKYQEHVNDHQVEIIDEFYNSGFILTGEVKEVSSLIKECSSFNPKSYKSNNYKFNKLISDTIDSFR